MGRQAECKKCLLDKLDMDLHKNVTLYIEALPEEQRCSEAEYRQRLEICLSCESCMNGMCRKCGCFIEARAAKKQLGCADAVKRW